MRASWHSSAARACSAYSSMSSMAWTTSSAVAAVGSGGSGSIAASAGAGVRGLRRGLVDRYPIAPGGRRGRLRRRARRSHITGAGDTSAGAGTSAAAVAGASQR
jgi:hypothetical protein